MSLSDLKTLAENLRNYLLQYPDLSVKAKNFHLDGLLSEGESMSLQITGGQIIKQYIDGSKIVLMPFVIFYRGTINDSNDRKSAMMGELNGIGTWLSSQSLPNLGSSFEIRRLSQTQLANIANQTEKDITYQAVFALEYITKN